MVFEFLDRDHAFATDLFHSIRDQFADGRVVVGRYGADLRLLLAGRDRPRHLAQRRNGGLYAAVETALDVDRASARRDIANSVSKDRVRQQSRRTRAVADDVTRSLGGLPQHLRAEVFLRVPEIELFGNGNAVVANDRRAPFLLNEH